MNRCHPVPQRPPFFQIRVFGTLSAPMRIRLSNFRINCKDMPAKSRRTREKYSFRKRIGWKVCSEIRSEIGLSTKMRCSYESVSCIMLQSQSFPERYMGSVVSGSEMCMKIDATKAKRKRAAFHGPEVSKIRISSLNAGCKSRAFLIQKRNLSFRGSSMAASFAVLSNRFCPPCSSGRAKVFQLVTKQCVFPSESLVVNIPLVFLVVAVEFSRRRRRYCWC